MFSKNCYTGSVNVTKPAIWKYIFVGVTVFSVSFCVSIALTFTPINPYLWPRNAPYLFSVNLLPFDIILAVVSLGLYFVRWFDNFLNKFFWIIIIFAIISIPPAILFFINDISIVFLGSALAN